MLRFQEKKTFKRYLYSQVSLWILGIFILFVCNAVYGVYKKAQSANAFLAEAQKNLRAMQDQEKYFSAEIERLKSDQGIEEEIRSKFQVAKEGEKVVVIIDKKEDQNVTAMTPQKNFFQKILDIF
ncbi:MAG: Uncharacterized protein G01um101448_579 [Parcubacteria group bacterium Gr01-1014_48]|nr:MAG: Uncharacterized protein Greene041614_669 [Parcubacteria group bacterium Greene0416_14]TSC73738.1 MAG: Uncharacterized protein G01um101448_579 [Parcubacteria group bacterium Gr01-1014_48]TSD01355.1 MAG: Uncharacterized protein Greene101415_290 [Parcubacteria group bacterium Greene1014_15]TSD07799.1 MAG: Uncharacterized protein Greene07144_706 [Parcubacteria group bacterium Greene0714_4]